MGRLCAQFNDELDGSPLDPVTLADRAAYMIERQLTSFLVAGEPALGLAQVRLRPSIWRGGSDACLEDLYVVPGARGRGFGRRLLAAAVDYARESGAVQMEISTSEADEAAVRLYEAAGFENRYRRSERARMLLYVRRLKGDSAN